MKTATKVFFGVVILLGAVVAGALLLLRETTDTAVPVTFSDGTTVRYVATTFGTNHVWGSTKFARTVLRLPRPVRDTILRVFPRAVGLTSRTTSQPRLVVWVENWGPAGFNPSTRRAFLRPVGGPIAGDDEHLSLFNGPTNSVTLAQLEFETWPRGEAQLECVLFEADRGFRFTEVGSFQFANPARLDAPPATNWMAQPLPATASAGDLNVTLLSFASGLGNNTTHKSTSDGRVEIIHEPAAPGDEPGALVQVRFDSPRGTNEMWIMFNADLADAGGNRIEATSRSDMTTRMRFSPVLWDEGQPWQLRLHLKRKEGFTPEELLVFTNVPLPTIGTTNQFNLTNSIAGIEVVLRQFIRRPDHTNSSWSSRDLSQLTFEHPALGESNQLDLISIIAHPAGTNLTLGGSSWSDRNHDYEFRSFPTNTTHLELRLAVQATRFVEFTVEPNWTTNKVILLRD